MDNTLVGLMLPFLYVLQKYASGLERLSSSLILGI